jgi:hypothetical protein
VFKGAKCARHGHPSDRDNEHFLRTYSPIKGPNGKIVAVSVASKKYHRWKPAFLMETGAAVCRDTAAPLLYLNFAAEFLVLADLGGRALLHCLSVLPVMPGLRTGADGRGGRLNSLSLRGAEAA